jgi:dolichyl-phosphate beta-glucosyltransferase
VKRLVQFGISLAIGGLILAVLLRRFDLPEVMGWIRQARPTLLLIGIAAMIASYLLRGARWRIWERRLRYSDSLRLILIGFMGNNVLPARLGEMLRARCAAAEARDERVRAAALASIAAERILDGLILAVLGLVGLILVPVAPWLRCAVLLISGAFAVLTSGLVLGAFSHDRVRALIAAANRKFPGHMTAFAREKSDGLLDGLLPLAAAPRMLGAIASTAVIWGIELLFYYFVGLAVWSGTTLAIALLFLVVVNFASLIPITMGGIGTIEVAATFFLVSAGIPPSPALAMVLLQHASQYAFTTLAGGLCYALGGFHRLARESARARPPSAIAEPSRVLEETRASLGRLGVSVALRPAPRGELALSIVIPAFNEQARLPRTVLETIRWCGSRDVGFELIIADDGSRDETLALGRLFEESDLRVRVLACPHMGKGAAVRMGILNAKGRYVLFMDADGATPLDEIPKLLAPLEQGYDVAVGSRVVQRPGEVEVKTSLHRRVIGRTFALLVNLLAVEGIGDTQCGFKMFRGEAAEAIFSRQKTVGFAFDVEILYIARRLSLAITEVPVNWVSQPGSKVNLVTDSVKMLRDICRIRWLHRNFE